MASGTIIAQTRTSDAYLPVENVTVAFFTPGQPGEQRLLAVRQSDASGKTAPVILEAPDFEESQQPEAEGAPVPYRIVDIVADHPDFERITVNGVQVFDGIVTYQDLMLVPLRAPALGNKPEEIFDTPDQNL